MSTMTATAADYIISDAQRLGLLDDHYAATVRDALSTDNDNAERIYWLLAESIAAHEDGRAVVAANILGRAMSLAAAWRKRKVSA